MTPNTPYQDKRNGRFYRIKVVQKMAVVLRPISGGGTITVSRKVLARHFVKIPDKEK